MRRLQPTVRLRLTALHAALVVGATGLLLGVSWLVLRGHLERTLPDVYADEVLGRLAVQYGLAIAGTAVLAGALGWAFAGRALSPVRRMVQTARRVSDEHLDERIDLRGPRDELHELAQTLDAMLDRLQAGVDAQRRFVANASHELRSPLTVIRTEAEVVLDDPDAGVEELRAMGEVVLEATERTESLLDGLLLLARAQRSLRRSDPVDLAALARRVAEAERPRAEEQRLDLHVAAEAAAVRGDEQLLERLVANLVDNAVRYGEPGRPLQVEVRAQGGTALLRIANAGAHLPEDALERLAEPFERLDRTAGGPGSGLGLSIVRSVAEAHGGALELRARPAGGLEARVELPLASDAADAPRGDAPRVLIRS